MNCEFLEDYLVTFVRVSGFCLKVCLMFCFERAVKTETTHNDTIQTRSRCREDHHLGNLRWLTQMVMELMPARAGD
jgi:hypothetical protein